MWFERHLNLTFFFAWIVGNIIIYSAIIFSDNSQGDTNFWILFVLAIIIILGTEIWYLLKKKRSLFFLLLNLVNWIGLILLLNLENKAINSSNKENRPQQQKIEQVEEQKIEHREDTLGLEAKTKKKKSIMRRIPVSILAIAIIILLIVFGYLLHTVFANTSSSPPVANVYWNDLVTTMLPLIDSSVPHGQNKQTDKEPMIALRDNLKTKNIDAGLVTIDSNLQGAGNLDYCVTVNTIDRGIVCLYIIPSDFKMDSHDNMLQEVYLQTSKRVGLLPVKYASSNQYSWYEQYLSDTYSYWDYCEYLSGYEDIVTKNKAQLDKLSTKIDNLVEFIENPPLFTTTPTSMDTSSIQSKYDFLTDSANKIVDQFNIDAEQFNAQVKDYNNEQQQADALSDKYPNEIIYIKEYIIDPLAYSIKPPTYSPITMPITIPLPSIFYTSVDSYLKALENRVNDSYSYTPLNKPDKAAFKSKRYTDENFIITSFKIKW